MVDLCPVVDHGILHLDEIADVRTLPHVRTRAQTGIGTEDHLCRNRRLLQMAKALDLYAVADGDAGPEHRVWTDEHVAAEGRVAGKKHRFRHRHGHAARHRLMAQALLQDRLGCRQFHQGVDAE